MDDLFPELIPIGGICRSVPIAIRELDRLLAGTRELIVEHCFASWHCRAIVRQRARGRRDFAGHHLFQFCEKSKAVRRLPALASRSLSGCRFQRSSMSFMMAVVSYCA